MPFSIRSLRRQVSRLGRELGEKTRTARRVLRIHDPHHVVPYRGYGNARTVLVQGRALQDEGIAPPTADDPAWRNLLNSFNRVETDPLPRARVRVQIGSTQREIIADEEGFITVMTS